MVDVRFKVLYIAFFLQDVVEERFDMEYLIALVVASVLISLIVFVALSLVAMRCRRRRDRKRDRKRGSIEGQQLQQQQRMIRSRSGAEVSSCGGDSVSTQVRISGNMVMSMTKQNLNDDFQKKLMEHGPGIESTLALDRIIFKII